MPAGLDGDPDPVISSERTRLITDVVKLIRSKQQTGRPMLIAVDGIDGAGKTTFADELAAASGGMQVVRATIDSFHHPRAIRWRRGRSSPLGFYLDSHDLLALRTDLLDPFKAGAGSTYHVAAFDEPSDMPARSNPQTVSPDDVLIFDGIFLQRPELADHWDLTIFLDGQERVNLRRLGQRPDRQQRPSEPTPSSTVTSGIQR